MLQAMEFLGKRCSQELLSKSFLIGCLVTSIFAQVMTPQIAKEILTKHNDYRRQESASNMYVLHWNVSLQERADSWASKCVFKHERNLDLGENLFFDTDHENDVFGRGMDEWHKEKFSWGYTSNSCTRACHFTQLVWGYTTTVGCSATVCPSLSFAGRDVKDAMLFVCYYYPRGNFVGSFPYAKGRPCSECAPGDTCSNGLCISSGPISKLAPDFVKSLTPLTPVTVSRPRHFFQEFQGLIQHFSSETSQGSHRQSSHQRSEHHQEQYHHFQSQSLVSSGSQSRPYSSQHSSAQQHHHQVYQSSHSQTYHQQRQHGERTDISQSQTYHQQRQHSEKTDISHSQAYYQQRQHGDARNSQSWQDNNKQNDDKRRQDTREHENHRRLETHNSNQQLTDRNDWLKEQDRLQRQGEENRRQEEESRRQGEESRRQGEESRRQGEESRRQELKERENQRRNEQEKRQSLLLEEQKRQAELEQRNQHALLQKRFQDEKIEMERVRTEEEKKRQRLVQDKDIYIRQVENERVRTLNKDPNITVDEYHRRQSQDHNPNSIQHSQNEAKGGRSFETKISLQPPAERKSALEPVHGDTVRRHSSQTTHQAKSTAGVNLQSHKQDNRGDSNGRHGTQLNYSNYEESYVSAVRNQIRYPSHAQETGRARYTTAGHVLKLLPIPETEKAFRTENPQKGYEVVSIPNWIGYGQRNETNSQSHERTRGLFQTMKELQGNSKAEEPRTEKYAATKNKSETELYVDRKNSKDNLSSLQMEKQPGENGRREVGERTLYRSKVLKQVEGVHPHKENFVMDSSGRRCVDRHVECVRWAVKCYKSSAVTLSCPMTCGKCGLHVNPEQNLAEQTEKLEFSQDGVSERAQEMKMREPQGKQTPTEKRARRHQRVVEGDKKGQQKPKKYSGAEETGQKQKPRRSKEERKRIQEQRKRERQRKQQAQERPSLCRDDPKHIKSCKYWAKKGFCVENKLIQNIYCQLSCGKCE